MPIKPFDVVGRVGFRMIFFQWVGSQWEEANFVRGSDSAMQRREGEYDTDVWMWHTGG